MVARIEQQTGPVTAVCYPASSGLRGPGAPSCPRDQVRALISAQADGLSNLLGAISAARLRLLLTISALPARYGAARHGAASLSAAALAEQARRLGQGLPGCRVLHADLPWPPGSGPAAPAELGRLLMNALAHGAAATRIAIHGRLGPRTPAADRRGQARAAGSWRQCGCTAPRVELVAEARVSTRTDPYLADYLLDGRTVLPPAIGLEAMAQAAAALAGRPLRDLADVSMEAPVVLPPGDRGDHAAGVRAATGRRRRDGAARRGHRLQPRSRAGVLPAASRHGLVPGGRASTGTRVRPASRLGLAAAVPGSIVDGTDVYGPICFQRGPFRRVAFLPEVTARSCRALIRGADDRPWFTPTPAGPGTPAGPACAPGRRADPGQPGAERRGDAHAASLRPGLPGAPGRIPLAHPDRSGGVRRSPGARRAGHRAGKHGAREPGAARARGRRAQGPRAPGR